MFQRWYSCILSQRNCNQRMRRKSLTLETTKRTVSAPGEYSRSPFYRHFHPSSFPSSKLNRNKNNNANNLLINIPCPLSTISPQCQGKDSWPLAARKWVVRCPLTTWITFYLSMCFCSSHHHSPLPGPFLMTIFNFVSSLCVCPGEIRW